MILLVAFSTHKLNKQQNNSRQISKSNFDLDLNFEKTSIILSDFSFPYLEDDKKTFSKADLLNKYSLVTFFASWCSTCHAQHHVLLKLKEEGIIDIYGVAWRDIKNNTITYLSNNGNPYKIVARDSKGEFSKITGINAVPENLIINPQGEVIRRFKGNLNEDFIRKIKNFLEEVRKEESRKE